jgi:hypothetical protein
MLIDGGGWARPQVITQRPAEPPRPPPSLPPAVPQPARTRVNTSPATLADAQTQTELKTTEAVAAEQWADQEIQRLKQLRQQNPALAYEFNDQIAQAKAEKQAARDELREAMVVEYREQAQNTPLDPGRDIYYEREQIIDARKVDAAFAPTYRQLAQEARVQARGAEAENVEEAQWQRNAQVWEAMQADWELASLERGLSGPGAPRESWVQPTLASAREKSTKAWSDVSTAFAREYKVVAREEPPSPYSHLAVENHRREIENSNLDPVYRDKILQASRVTTAQSTDAQEISDVTEPYATRVQNAYRTGGAPAGLAEIDKVQQELAGDPFVNGPGLDPSVSQSRLIAAQEDLDKKLRPTYEAIAANAPQDLAALAAAQPAEGTEEQYARAETVSARLNQYAQLLPPDLVPELVQRSKDSWQPAVQFLGEQSNDDTTYRYTETDAFGTRTQKTTTQSAADSSHYSQQDGMPEQPLYYDRFNAVVGNFAQVGDVLAGTPGGDDALVDMGGAFAENIDNDDIGAFDEALGLRAIADRKGAHLGVEVTNQLVAGGKTDAADNLLQGIQSGNKELTKQSQDTLDAFVENRDALNHYVLNFPAAQPNADCPQPGEVDAGGLERQDAVLEYLRNNPDVVEEDARLLVQVDRDGHDLWSASAAVSSLSKEAMALEHGDDASRPLNEFFDPNENAGVAQVYASTPSVQAEVAQGTAMVLNYQRTASASANLSGDSGGLLQSLSDQQRVVAIPRNVRGLIDAYDGKLNEAFKSIGGSDVQPAFRGSGIAFYAYGTLVNWADASGVGRQNLNNLDIWSARLNTVGYAGQTTRVSAQLLTAKFSQNQSLRAFLDVGTVDNKSVAYLSGQVALVPLRGVFVASDVVTLVNDVRRGNGGPGGSRYAADGAILVGDSATLFAGAAGAGLLEGAGVAAGAGWVPVVGWVGAGLVLAGSITKYALGRSEQANRYENADQRRFLAHFGSRDDAGVLKPFTASTEVSDAVSHDPEIRHVSDGRPKPGDIVYTGLSADAVDELMNHDSSGDGSAIPMLGAYAEANGIDSREMYLNWYNNLTHDQRKALPVAGFGVDPDEFGNYPQGFTDGSIIEGWSQGWSTRQQFGEAGGVSNEQYDAVIDYVNDHGIYREDDPDTPQLEGDGYTTYDPQAIKVMLGIEPPRPGQSAPSQEVIGASRAIIADELYGDLDRGFRPHTMDEFKFWTEIHHYPALPAGTCEPLPAKPKPRAPVLPVAIDRPPPAEPQPQPQPQPQPPVCDHEYIVQPGDNLWDIAARSTKQLDVFQLMAYHNSHNPANQTDFDPQRADKNFFTPHDPVDERRDPDLIHPGEVIYVDCADDTAPRLPDTA